MSGHCLESAIGKMREVLRIHPMKVDAPRCGKGSVLMKYMLFQVVFLQYIITHQTATLTFTCHISYPVKSSLGVTTTIFTMVFHPTPIGVNHQQAIIANAFKLGDLIAIHSRFPSPFTHIDPLGIAVIECHAIRKLREGTLLLFFG